MSSPPSPTCSDFSSGLRAMIRRGWSAGGSRNSWPNALSSARRKWICLLHTREGAGASHRPATDKGGFIKLLLVAQLFRHRYLRGTEAIWG